MLQFPKGKCCLDYVGCSIREGASARELWRKRAGYQAWTPIIGTSAVFGTPTGSSDIRRSAITPSLMLSRHGLRSPQASLESCRQLSRRPANVFASDHRMTSSALTKRFTSYFGSVDHIRKRGS